MSPRAALFDVDGTLVRSHPSGLIGYYLTTGAHPLQAAGRLVRELGRGLLAMAADRVDRSLSNRVLYTAYGGQEERRLLSLADEAVDAVLLPKLFQGVRELLRQRQEEGMTVVLISGSPHFIVRRLGARLGLDEALCFGNRLEFRDGVCTGRLLRPILSGSGKVTLVRELAGRHGWSLPHSHAYSDDTSDLPLLSSVGHPTAVNPTAKLRQEALARGWPILDLARPGPH